MRLIREAHEVFIAEPDWHGSASFEVSYDNMGEPYREGARFTIRDGDSYNTAFLDAREVKRLHACLSKMLGQEPALSNQESGK